MRECLGLVALALSVVFTAVLTPAVALAAPPQCHIVNQTTDAKFDNLQAAVDAADPGDRLKLKGTCVGPTTIAKDLTIEGHSNPAFGPATLDAAGAASPTVRINSGDVTLDGLTVTGGNGFFGLGGGILALFCNCSVTLNDSTVRGNTGLGGGAGIFALRAALTLNNSTVSDNVGSSGAGVVVSCSGLNYPITLNNSTISYNRASSNGGGMFSQQCAVSLNDSVVANNSAGVNGGGIANYNGSVVLNNSHISDNSAGGVGGGIHNISSTLTLDGTSTISGNIPEDCAGVSCP